MKVALLSSGSGSHGGGEIYLRFLAEGLSAEGCEVHALVPAAERMDVLAESLRAFASVHRLPVKATYERRLRNLAAFLDLRQQRYIISKLLDLAPDIVHVNQQVAEDGLDFLASAAASGLPWLSTIHIARSAASLQARFGGFRDLVTKRALLRPGALYVTVSEASREQLVARLRADASRKVRIAAVHNGVPTPEPRRLSSAREKARREWRIANDEVVIGAVGRVEAQKNPFAFVDFIRPLVDAGLPVRAVWIGDGQMRPEMEAYAARTIGTDVLLVDNWRSDAAIRLAGFDIYLLPSLFEGLPLALLEAMHAGLPVVAAHTDGTPEAIEDGASGYLCTREEQFTDRLQQLVADAGLRVRLGGAARDTARQCFSTAALAKRTKQLYKAQIDTLRQRSRARR